MPSLAADPYPWPWNGDWRPDNTALIVIDMQTDFCGNGRLCRQDGLRPLADPRADRADQGASSPPPAPRATTSSTPARATGPTSPTCRQQALALAAHRRRHRRRRPLRQHPGARRAGLGDHRGAEARAGRADHRQAGQGLVLRHRPRTHPAHPRHRQSRADRHHHRRLRPHHHARGQRPRLRMPDARGLLRRDRPRQPRRRGQDGEDAGRRVRRGREFVESLHRGPAIDPPIIPPAGPRSTPSA